LLTSSQKRLPLYYSNLQELLWSNNMSIISCLVCNTPNRVPENDNFSLPLCGKCKSPLIERLDNINSSIHNTILNDRCVICGYPAHQYNSLVNGKVFHEECYKCLLQAQIRIEENIVFLRKRIHELKTKQEKARSVIGRLRIWLTGEQEDIIDTILRNSHPELKMAELLKLNETISNNLQSLYDYWPTYPPDWETRKDKVRSNQQFCEECRQHIGPLHVHHIIPLSKGGNHKNENLKLLCEGCHSTVHGGRDFTYSYPDEEPSSYIQRLRMLREAINNGQIVRFSYTRYDGVQSLRSIIPHEIIPVNDTACVTGYCYLREEKRTFSVKRMKNVRISDSPGKCYYK